MRGREGQFTGFGMTDREIRHMQDEAARLAQEKREQRDAMMRAHQDEMEIRRIQQEGSFRDMSKGDLTTAARAKK